MVSAPFWSQMFSTNIDLHGGANCQVPLGRGISLKACMDDFTNQAGCRCKVIFHIHMTGSFHLLWLDSQLGEDYLRPHKYTYSFGDPLEHLKENYCLTHGQNHLGGSLGERSHGDKRNHPGDSRMFCGYLSQYCSGSMEGSSALKGSPNSTPSLP